MEKSTKDNNIELGDEIKLGNHTLICADTTKFDFLEYFKDEQFHMLFTDPPYELDDHNWVSQFIQDEVECFIMHRDKAVVDIASSNRKYFRYFYIVELDPAWYIGNKTAFLGHTPIAYFRKGRTRFQNLHDRFKTLIPPSSVKSLGTHEKSVELAETFIKHFTLPGQNVIDCFAGTGSTLIACEKTERKAVLVEKDPVMCKYIIERYNDYTNQKKLL